MKEKFPALQDPASEFCPLIVEYINAANTANNLQLEPSKRKSETQRKTKNQLFFQVDFEQNKGIREKVDL